MQHQPCMKSLEGEGLANTKKLEVHYCKFGADYKKPTNIWSVRFFPPLTVDRRS
jgi:hypothetical protein